MLVANLFNNTQLSELSIGVLKKMPFLVPYIIKQTHGKPMSVE